MWMMVPFSSVILATRRSWASIVWVPRYEDQPIHTGAAIVRKKVTARNLPSPSFPDSRSLRFMLDPSPWLDERQVVRRGDAGLLGQLPMKGVGYRPKQLARLLGDFPSLEKI